MTYLNDENFIRKNRKILEQTTEWRYKGKIYLLEKGREEELKKIIKENVDKPKKSCGSCRNPGVEPEYCSKCQKNNFSFWQE